MGLRVSESWGAAGRERAARWLTGRAAPSVGCVRAVRVGLKRREGGSACWAAGAGEGEEKAAAELGRCEAGRGKLGFGLPGKAGRGRGLDWAEVGLGWWAGFLDLGLGLILFYSSPF